MTLSPRLLLVLALVATAFTATTAAEQGEPPPQEESPFQRRDTPPSEVLAQLNFGGAVRGDAGLDCTFGPSIGARSEPACFLEVAEDGALAFEGFAPNEVISIEVARSDGSVERVEVVADARGSAHVPTIALPGDPLGVHSVTAAQGGLQASGSFSVRAASEPRSVVLPRAAPPGTGLQVALTGFPAGTPVRLRLYRDIAETYWFLAELPLAVTNEQGEALYALSTRPDDAEGRYLVVTQPAVAGPGQLNGQFLLTRGGDPTLRDPNELISALAQAALENAHRVWIGVLAEPDRGVADLERVFGGPRLARARAEVDALHASGQLRVARLAAPLVVRRVQELSRFRIDAEVSEVWDDRLLNADGSLVRDMSGSVERRYALELRFEPCYCWLVVEAN